MGYIHHHTRPCTHPDRRDSPPRTRHGGKRTADPKGAMTSANAWIHSLVPVERSEWTAGDWSGMERPGGGWLGWDSVGEQSDLPRYRGPGDHLPPRAIHRAVDWIALGPQPGGQDDLSHGSQALGSTSSPYLTRQVLRTQAGRRKAGRGAPVPMDLHAHPAAPRFDMAMLTRRGGPMGRATVGCTVSTVSVKLTHRRGRPRLSVGAQP